jgi:hypothetical protein
MDEKRMKEEFNRHYELKAKEDSDSIIDWVKIHVKVILEAKKNKDWEKRLGLLTEIRQTTRYVYESLEPIDRQLAHQVQQEIMRMNDDYVRFLVSEIQKLEAKCCTRFEDDNLAHAELVDNSNR